MDDHKDDVNGPYQGGAWDKGAGSWQRISGGPKHNWPVLGVPSTADLPPLQRRPVALGHVPLYDGGRCLICGHRPAKHLEEA